MMLNMIAVLGGVPLCRSSELLSGMYLTMLRHTFLLFLFGVQFPEISGA